MNGLGAVIGDALVVLGVVVMTIGALGIFRMPDIYTKLHAASKSVVLGVVAIGGGAMFTGEPGIIARVVLISVILLLTTPVASHIIGRGAFLEREHMETPGALDESGQHLNEPTTTPAEAPTGKGGETDSPTANGTGSGSRLAESG